MKAVSALTGKTVKNWRLTYRQHIFSNWKINLLRGSFAWGCLLKYCRLAWLEESRQFSFKLFTEIKLAPQNKVKFTSFMQYLWYIIRGIDLRHLSVYLCCLLPPGLGVSPHPELPQGQMDSLLSIISSQRERFRSRNQELEAVSHDLWLTHTHIHTHPVYCLFLGELISHPFVSSVPCRKIAPCSRPCRPCRMN